MNKVINKNYNTVETVPKSSRTIIETRKIRYHTTTHIHNCSLSWLGAGISIKSGGVK
jgi:hypothetical protein